MTCSYQVFYNKAILFCGNFKFDVFFTFTAILIMKIVIMPTVLVLGYCRLLNIHRN